MRPVALGALLVLMACNGDDEATPQPAGTDSGLTQPTWADCETSSLRYDTFAQPMLATWCTPCHSSDLDATERSGAPVGIDFDSYDSVVALGSLIASSIEEERMPPVGGLSPDEREAFVAWVDCGMPRGEEPDPTVEVCSAPVSVSPSEIDCTDPTQADGVVVTGDWAPSASATCVCEVEGELTLSSSIELDHLTTVDGAVAITAGAVELPALVETGPIGINGQSLERVQLDALEVVHGDVAIVETSLSRVDLPRLDVVEGDLLVTGNRLATSGIRFANVRVVQGSARFIDNDALVDQVLFGHLEQFDGDLEVHGNDALQTLVGLGTLVDLGGRVEITENPELQLINLGIHLETVGGGLSVLGNPSLGLVETFPALTSVGMAGTPNPADPGADSLYLVANSQLGGIAAFPALEALGGLYIGGAVRLAAVGPFPSLTTLPGHVVLENTREVTDPPDLGDVTTIGGDLRIDGNQALDTLAPLASLSTIGGDLTIIGNDSLPVPSAEAFVDSVTVGGSTTLAP